MPGGSKLHFCLCLLLFSVLSAPQWVGCDCSLPNETSELLGILEDPKNTLAIFTDRFAFSFQQSPDLVFTEQCKEEKFFTREIDLDVVFAVCMRC